MDGAVDMDLGPPVQDPWAEAPRRRPAGLGRARTLEDPGHGRTRHDVSTHTRVDSPVNILI